MAGLRQVLSGGSGHFDLRPLCEKGDLKNIKEYWNRFCDQLELKGGKHLSTPLHEAVRRGHFEVVEFLLSKGASKEAITSTGKTPLYMASEGAYIDISLLLIHYKAQLVYDHNGRSVSCYDTNDGPSLRIVTDNDEEVPPSQKPQLIKRCLLSASRLELIDVLERLIVKDPSSFPAAIKEAQEHKKHKSVAFLKLVQCAIEGDSELVGKLYGNTTGRGITSEVRAAVLRVPTRVPLELARTRSHRFVFREILIHTKLTRKHKSLEVHWNNLGVSDVSLSDLYVLQRIASVTVLSIAHNCLTSIQENFEVLSKLAILDLSSNQLTAIHPVLFSLPSLWSLNLSGNSLARLPTIEEPQYTLTHLDLSSNKFNQVPFVIEKLRQIAYLNLSYNDKIESLPMWISSLEFLNDLRVEGLMSLDSRLKDSSTEGALELLKNQSENSRNFYEMKMIITGVSNSGKTSFVNKIRNTTTQPTSPIHIPPTGGVVISNWLYRLSEDSKEYEFIVWDIGNSELIKQIGVSLEEIFYTPFAMYVIVFNIVSFQQDLPEIKQRLDAIARRSSPSCVVFLGTHVDLVEDHVKSYLVQETEKALKPLISTYSKKLIFGKTLVETVSLAPGKTQNITEVCNSIFNLASTLYCHDGQQFMGRKVLLSGLGLKGEVEEYCRGSYQGAKPPVLTYEEIRKMVTNLKDVDVQSHDELENISQFLNQVGCLLHFDVRGGSGQELRVEYIDSLRDVYFMNPHWLYDKLQSIFLQLHSIHKSLFHYEDLHQYFVSNSTSDNQSSLHENNYLVSLLAVLVHIKLLIPLREGHTWYICPSLLDNELKQETRDQLYSIPYTHCQQYEHKDLKTIWPTFLLQVLEKITPLPKPIQDSTSKQMIVCWKSGLAWSNGDGEGIFIEAKDSKSMIIKYTYSLEYANYIEDISDFIHRLFPQTTMLSYSCIACLAAKSNQVQSFTLPQCIQALVSGKTYITCNDEHVVKLEDLIPFLCIRPTHTMTQLNHHLKNMHYFSSTANYFVYYNAKYRGQPVLLLKYFMTSEKALRELSSKSISLECYNTPGLSNKEGRLLALAVDKTHALLVCEVPQLGTFSADSQSDNPVISSSCVLHRIAVQLAKALTQVPDWLPQGSITDLQFWNLDERSLLHCSLVISDRCLRLMLGKPIQNTDQFNDTRIDTWLYYMKNLSKLVPTGSYYLGKFLRPSAISNVSLESLVNIFSSISVQLIGDVQPLASLQSPITASPCPSLYSGALSSTASSSPVADLWMSSLYRGKEELRISVYSIMTQINKVFKVKSNPIEVLAVQVNTDHIWISTQLPDNIGCLSIFNASTKKLAHNVKMSGNAITCMEHMKSDVCAGTKAGFLFIFPDDVYAVKKSDPKPRHKFIGEGQITGLLAIGTQLYIAHSNTILIFDTKDMKVVSSLTPPDSTQNDDFIGHLFLSPTQPLIYSVHYATPYIKTWDINEAKHMLTINVQDSLRGLGKTSDGTITALTAAIDTVWVGLNTGHLIVYHERDVVTCFQPYQGPINFLSRFIDGERCMIISGGERYISPTHDEPLHKEPVLLTWNVYPKNILRQLKILEESRGEHLNSFEFGSLIHSEHGFKETSIMSRVSQPMTDGASNDSTLTEDFNLSADTISVQLPNRQIVSIPACSAKSMESLLSTLESEGLQSINDSLSIVYHYQLYETLVNVTTDDDLMSYLELFPDRPMLVFMNDHL